MRRPALWIATCCGIGYAPVAPGTAGAALGMIPVLLLWRFPYAYAAAAAVLFFAGVWAATAAERILGRTDASEIVIDETMSMMITMAGLAGEASPWVLLAGFLLNRVCDIVKPYPAGALQRAPGGWGVMLDDLASGVQSNLLLRGLLLLWGTLA